MRLALLIAVAIGCGGRETSPRAEGPSVESQDSPGEDPSNEAPSNDPSNEAPSNEAPNIVAAPQVEGRPCPTGSARLPDTDVCMDRFEALLRGEGESATAVPADHERPADSIAWEAADRACRNAGKRLCTRAEWLLACAGPTGTRSFPYGDEHELGRCNHTASGVNRPLAIAMGGEYEGCVTPEGIHDLVGNVGEWLSDPDPSGDLRETIGGSFGTDVTYARCDYANRAYQPKGDAWSGQGFRCCADHP